MSHLLKRFAEQDSFRNVMSLKSHKFQILTDVVGKLNFHASCISVLASSSHTMNVSQNNVISDFVVVRTKEV